MGKFLKISVLALLLFAMPNNAESKAKSLTAAETGKIQQVVASVKPTNMGIGDLKVKSAQVDGTELQIDLSDNFGDIPFTRESIEQLRSDIVNSLGEKYTDYTVKLSIANNDIERYFVDFEDSFKRSHKPFVTSADPMRHYDKGLDGNIIAMWPSHGWYFEPLLNRWEWQRARLFQTVEDMYTHSYVLPFLIPMLENAGAYVWNARERDTHEIMAVVDNDGSLAQNGYSEHNGSHKWRTGDGKGFAYKQNAYRDFENPFMSGTYREVAAVADEKNASVATWDVDMPEAGSYAVYVSYRTQPNSVSDAHYTINSLAGAEEFVVDQTMGGGVWVYLGTFELKKGVNKAVVKLSNYSQSNGVVTADAVKVGGGMGNIERRVALPTEKNKAIAAEQKNEKYLGKPDVEYKYVGSNRPWFMLGSRYYMQWAGFPDSVYSTSHGINDYVDDYRSRGEWVNYLAGGSEVLPNQKGLNVPVDLSFCLHTDAGTTPNDDIVGTLSIYCTKKDGNDFGNYENGTKRILSRTFADMISTEVVNDIRAKYEPNWSRRGMWDKPYYEARVPEVPALLVELLSHQNFADMKYGLDPNFRFDVSRSFYKAMVKFIASRDKREYEIQPLPVNAFAIAADGDSKFVLTWKPTVDELCDKAEAKQYIVYERVGKGGFKQVAVTA
ncbi:MAG: N-acetylmuramoyl-L-alanine amidase, partial [Muribaculaceae bacterium]|nr:N-acetylmuramoyl-L-alanine amidase [Muribaculaceae bacterium]